MSRSMGCSSVNDGVVSHCRVIRSSAAGSGWSRGNRLGQAAHRALPNAAMIASSRSASRVAAKSSGFAGVLGAEPEPFSRATVASAGERRARRASSSFLQAHLVDLAHLEEHEHALPLVIERREEPTTLSP